MSIRLALCLLLLCASFPLVARDARMMSASGAGSAGSCQDDSAQNDDPTLSQAAGKRAAHPVKPASKPRVAPSRSGGDPGDVRPPRWHSFLPGMFR